MTNPTWVTDELILALHFYKTNLVGRYSAQSPEIAQLAQEISHVSMAVGLSSEPGLRNYNSVYMKLMNFRARDPAARARGQSGLQRGNRLELELWERFENHDSDLEQIVAAIRTFGTSNEVIVRNLGIDIDPSIPEAEEGRLLTHVHVSRERNHSLVRRKKVAFRARHRHLFCEVCKFDFAEIYGKRGEGFIECHHLRPVSELRPGDKTTLRDLVLLCANCHRMIHAKKPWLTVDELRAVLQAAREA